MEHKWVGTFLIAAVLGLSSVPFSAGAFGPDLEGNAYVHNFSDFRLYVDSHRLRVQRLGLLLYGEFPDRYKDLPLNLVSEFLELHDQAKQQESNARALYAFYGRNQKFMEPTLRESFVAVIRQINENDASIGESFLQRSNISPQQKELLLEIEKVADLVDRGMDPVAREDFEERGRYSMKLGSEFIQQEFSKNAALQLEQSYVKATEGLSFLEQKASPRTLCVRVF